MADSGHKSGAPVAIPFECTIQAVSLMVVHLVPGSQGLCYVEFGQIYARAASSVATNFIGSSQLCDFIHTLLLPRGLFLVACLKNRCLRFCFPSF